MYLDQGVETFILVFSPSSQNWPYISTAVLDISIFKLFHLNRFSSQQVAETYCNLSFLFLFCLLGEWWRLWEGVRTVCALLQSFSGEELLTTFNLKRSLLILLGEKKNRPSRLQLYNTSTHQYKDVTGRTRTLCFSVVNVIQTSQCVHLE